MYRILGADGKEYGPVNGDALRQWITEGRINAQTRVRLEGSADWQALASVPEFEAIFGVAPGAPPPPAGAPGGSKTSGMAIASLVLGILGFCGITALVGLVLGIVALTKISRSGGRLSGQGMAIAGICVSGFMLLFSVPMVAGMMLPALARAKQQAQAVNCINNMRQLGLGVKIYANGHGGMLPPATTWCDAIQSNVGSPKVYQCPTEPGLRCAYAFNAKLGGKKDNQIDPQTVLLFESDAGWNATGSASELKPHRHSSGMATVAFADGSVQKISQTRLSTLRWDP
jgi:prepilin-type processing-associated H-X9-DG protein